MVGGYKNMRSKVGPARGLSALEPNNAKKSTFLGPIFDFLGPFLGHFGPKWPLSWWEPWARVPKGPRISRAPNPEKKCPTQSGGHFSQKRAPKNRFLGPSSQPPTKKCPSNNIKSAYIGPLHPFMQKKVGPAQVPLQLSNMRIN